MWMGGLDGMAKNRSPKVLVKVQKVQNCSRIRRNLISMVSSLNSMDLKGKTIFFLVAIFVFRLRQTQSFICYSHFHNAAQSIHIRLVLCAVSLYIVFQLHFAFAIFFLLSLSIHIFVWWHRRLILLECSKLTN